MVTQYVDGEEAKEFHNMVKNMPEEIFNSYCDNFFVAIKRKDKVAMFRALAIFDEMDAHNLGTDSMKRRLKRVRESTHEVAYNI